MKISILAVVMMLFMSVGLNAQEASMKGQDYFIPSYYTTNYFWGAAERLFEKSKIFKINDEIAKKNSSYALTPGEIYHLKCLYIWGMINEDGFPKTVDRWNSKVPERRVYCKECADYVTIPWRFSSPHMEIKKILNEEGLAALLGGSGYMELIRQLREIANYNIIFLYTAPDRVTNLEYLRYDFALSDRDACKRFCR